MNEIERTAYAKLTRALSRRMAEGGLVVLPDGKAADILVEIRVRTTESHDCGLLSFIPGFTGQSSTMGKVDTCYPTDAQIVAVHDGHDVGIERLSFRANRDFRARKVERAFEMLISDHVSAKVLATRHQEAHGGRQVVTIATDCAALEVGGEARGSTYGLEISAARCDRLRATGVGQDLPRAETPETTSALAPTARPSAEAMAEERAWNLAKPAECVGGARSPTCSGVARYLAEFPEGRHSFQAKALLKLQLQP